MTAPSLSTVVPGELARNEIQTVNYLTILENIYE